jgi:hypothetical protein
MEGDPFRIGGVEMNERETVGQAEPEASVRLFEIPFEARVANGGAVH